MKPPRRIDPEAFNPEKFLVADLHQKKQELVKSYLLSRDLMIPITFTPRFSKYFLEKLVVSHPEAFKISPALDGSAFGRLRTAIANELALLGLAENQTLLTVLIAGLLGQRSWLTQMKKYNPGLMKGRPPRKRKRG
jgi:hypothetical protein